MKLTEERAKQAASECHDLRLKVNRLLAERQTHMSKIERYRCVDWDLSHQVDIEKKKCYEALEKEKNIAQRSKDMVLLFQRQIRLKEMFEDKLKDTLDMRINKNGSGLQTPNEGNLLGRSNDGTPQGADGIA